MGVYKIANLNVKMAVKGNILAANSIKYKVDGGQSFDFKLGIKQANEDKLQSDLPHLSMDELEYIITGSQFSKKLLDYNGFCLHSSAVVFNNKTILFSAPSGTGKSTHANLWKEYFGGEKVLIINDDKPAIRIFKDEIYVYGSPWSGKTNLNLNTNAPLEAVVFMERSKKNFIRKLASKEAVKMLFYQSMKPTRDRELIIKLMEVIDQIIKRVNIYKMGCSISNEAVEVVYNELFNGNEMRDSNEG